MRLQKVRIGVYSTGILTLIYLISLLVIVLRKTIISLHKMLMNWKLFLRVFQKH